MLAAGSCASPLLVAAVSNQLRLPRKYALGEMCTTVILDICKIEIFYICKIEIFYTCKIKMSNLRLFCSFEIANVTKTCVQQYSCNPKVRRDISCGSFKKKYTHAISSLTIQSVKTDHFFTLKKSKGRMKSFGKPDHLNFVKQEMYLFGLTQIWGLCTFC